MEHASFSLQLIANNPLSVDESGIKSLDLSGKIEIGTRSDFKTPSSCSMSGYAGIASCVGMAEVTVSEAP